MDRQFEYQVLTLAILIIIVVVALAGGHIVEVGRGL